MLLKSGTWWHRDWNNIIIPAISNGSIKQIKATKKPFLRMYQLFYGILEEDDVQFRVTAWGYPNNNPHVHVEMIGRVRE